MQSTTTTTNRRSLLAGFALAPLVALPVAAHAAESGGDDAELIRLAAAFAEADARCDALCERYDFIAARPIDVDREIRVLVRKKHALAEAAADIRAATPAGLRAKAEIMMSFMAVDLDGTPTWENHDDLLSWSIARDLLAAGRA